MLALTPLGRALVLAFRDRWIDLTCDDVAHHRTLEPRGTYVTSCPIPKCTGERAEYDGDSGAPSWT